MLLSRSFRRQRRKSATQARRARSLRRATRVQDLGSTRPARGRANRGRAHARVKERRGTRRSTERRRCLGRSPAPRPRSHLPLWSLFQLTWLYPGGRQVASWRCTPQRGRRANCCGGVNIPRGSFIRRPGPAQGRAVGGVRGRADGRHPRDAAGVSTARRRHRPGLPPWCGPPGWLGRPSSHVGGLTRCGPGGFPI